MTRLLSVSLVLLALAPAAANAQATAEEGRKACNADARRFCKNVFKDGDMAIYSCLQTNAAKLKASCRKVVAGY
jgi:hypothetical protein